MILDSRPTGRLQATSDFDNMLEACKLFTQQYPLLLVHIRDRSFRIALAMCMGTIERTQYLFRALQTYRQDPNYWRSLTRATFRIPPQPLLQADGARWQWLYRRLRTQTQLYTWGSNGCGNLGHGFSVPKPPNTHEIDTSIRNIGWPKRVALDHMPEDIGIVADVQCGGWSTTLLNSIGCLYLYGAINEISAFMTRSVRISRDGTAGAPQARRLTFPPAYPSTTKDLYEPSTAIAQFSTGRKHVLGLADDGKVWQWNVEVARLIKPLHVDIVENRIPLRSGESETDAVLIETATIPGTGLSKIHSTHEYDSDTLESRIGQVDMHIVLENYIVFTTKSNKIFLYRTNFPLPELDVPEPVELSTFYPASAETPFEIRDLQGSFRSFAVFTTAGDVLMGDRTMLDTFHTVTNDPSNRNPTFPNPTVIPALQNIGIISIAFGDHHYQALRSDGTVLAYGTDSQACGALGLGFPEGTGPLRGLRISGFSSNGLLGDNVGRQVWFDPTMHRWLADMRAKGRVEGEAKLRGDMVLSVSEPPWQDPAAVTAMGDYFEREGRKWEDGVVTTGGGGSEMAAYFALKVAAAGWHSAALVLVDEEKVERVRRMHVRTLSPEEEREDKKDGNEAEWEEEIDAPWDQLSKAM
ncbi:MAG: hypothetical protein Q9219_007633, partial [cf. Caloplaca sp. 3 TL-2023]